jgi:GcrA cell cycle regulator
MKTVWPPALETQLIEFWNQGMSASLIAKELNKEFKSQLTRNAVIGKAHRLKLPSHKVLVVKERPKPKSPERRLLVIQRHKVVNVVVRPPRMRNVSLFDLQNGACRWPVSDGAPWKFCGAPAFGTYCVKHGGMAWVKKSR